MLILVLRKSCSINFGIVRLTREYANFFTQICFTEEFLRISKNDSSELSIRTIYATVKGVLY